MWKNGGKWERAKWNENSAFSACGNIESELKSFVKITAPVKYLLKTVNLVRDKFDVENGTKILPVSADGKSLIKLKLTIVLVQE